MCCDYNLAIILIITVLELCLIKALAKLWTVFFCVIFAVLLKLWVHSTYPIWSSDCGDIAIFPFLKMAGCDRATCARDEEIKKQYSTVRYSGKQGIRPDHPMAPTSSDWNTVWHGGWSSGSSYKFQVSSTSAERRLPSCEGSKFFSDFCWYDAYDRDGVFSGQTCVDNDIWMSEDG